MKTIMARFALSALSLFAATAFAAEDPAAAAAREAESLRRELSALESLRAEKLETLERKEAARWEARYKAAAKAKETDDRLRGLEDAFGRAAADAGRLEEELVKARNLAEEGKEALAAAKEGAAAMAGEVKRRIDEAASAVSSDFPVGMEERTLAFSQASSAADRAKEGGDLRPALEGFFRASLDRLDLGLTQDFEARQGVFENGRVAPAWRLRIGTLFVGELEKDGGATQLLLRTGALQGRTYVWRQNLAGDFNGQLQTALESAHRGGKTARVPVDVLQSKGSGSGFVKGEEKSTWRKFTEWFKAGGVTLYPLFAVGILALLMIIERLVFFGRRSINTDVFMSKFLPLADRRDWKAAMELCAGSKSSLAAALGAVAQHASAGREGAEKAVQEILLREIPGHERRLSLLAAMGTAAPLLGLLGTVSGLVKLFKVLNQLGSNDPKVLAGGISEALVNTETGLAIAIPVLLIHGWLQERVDTLNAVLSAKTLEVLNKIWPKS